MADARTPPVAGLIEAAARSLAADPAGAERQAAAILRGAPGDPRALLILASARRRQGDPAAALAVLEPLARAHPRAAHTHYELGAARAARGDASAAVAALRQATSLNRELAEAWRALGDALFKAGDTAGADAAFAEHARAGVRDPRLKPAAEAVFRGDLAAAEQGLQAHLARQPNDVAALQMLAEVAARQGRMGDAEVMLHHALQLDASAAAVRFSYARILFQQQKAAEALPQVERLLAEAPREAPYRNLMAACLGLVGEYAGAIAVYEALLADYPRQPMIWLNYGHALRTVRRSADAVAAYKRCIDLAPGLGDAYWSLANLKVAPFTDSEVSAMRAQLDRGDLGPEDRLHLNYALGKALEDAGDDEGSFRRYLAGADIRRQTARYDPEATADHVRRCKALFTPAFFQARAGGGDPSDAPIFVLGLPRSGSTLVEQILASQPAVEGTMELSDLGFIAQRLGWTGRDDRYPEALADLGAADLAALGADYLQATRIHRKLDRPHFVDKMPNNVLHLGLIHLILPRARIIDARRHPLGACFSIFKQHFAQGHAYSYDLEHLGRHYRDYAELTAHIDAVLPARVHRVIYEDLVADTEGEVRRLLAYCGLPFDPACLRFYDNDRAVNTVSSEQVRRPIFREGLDRWRRYEPWLGPVKAALGPALAGWRGS